MPSRCPAGQAQGATGQDSCTDCSSGTNCILLVNLTACLSERIDEACKRMRVFSLCVGKYSSMLGSASCNSCVSGRFTSRNGMNNCTKCSKGTISSEGARMCRSCAPGFYSEAEGSTSCSACSSGTFISNSSSTFCEKWLASIKLLLIHLPNSLNLTPYQPRQLSCGSSSGHNRQRFMYQFIIASLL